MKYFSFSLSLLLAGSLFAVPLAHAASPYKVTVTAEALQEEYQDSDPLKILIVPGHEPTYGGTQFKGLYEREVVLQIASELQGYLNNNGNYEVYVSRDAGGWNPKIERTFDSKSDLKKISSYVKKQKATQKKLIKKNNFNKPGEGEQVGHNAAPTDVALRLYAINRWANANDIDLVVNLHINDTPDHDENTPSIHSGYSIYIPDAQYGNGKASRPIAEAVAARLSATSATSTLPGERAGVIEDQELIAIGAYNTLEAPSLLIEYGYITEARFHDASVRNAAVRDYAYQTYLGIQDFFKDPVATKYSSLMLPSSWTKELTPGASGADVYALQAALKSLALYPPLESDNATCPITGVAGECTTAAISAFQKSKGLPATGTFDAQTRSALSLSLGRR